MYTYVLLESSTKRPLSLYTIFTYAECSEHETQYPYLDSELNKITVISQCPLANMNSEKITNT